MKYLYKNNFPYLVRYMYDGLYKKIQNLGKICIFDFYKFYIVILDLHRIYFYI